MRRIEAQQADGAGIVNDLPRKLPIWPGAPAASNPRTHVHQRCGPDCAIAAAATITGVAYDEAASLAFSLREDGLGGMRPQAMVNLLYRLTDMPWRVERSFRSKRVRLASMVFPVQLVVACIVSPWRRRGHAIVARERVIYDGLLEGPVGPQEHPYKNWFVGWMVVRALR
jgi:hypothetical protein